MNLLATASDLQIKGLSQIQETRTTTQLTSEATPPLPEVKPAKQQTSVEVNKVKPAAELRVKPVAPAPPPPSSQEGRLSQETAADELHHPQHSGNSLKRKHDQSGSEQHSRISFRSNSSSGWSGGGGHHSSRHQQQQQQDCEERQVAAALRDLKTEVGDLGSSGSSGSAGALAPLPSEDNTRLTTQVLTYFQQERYRYFIFLLKDTVRYRTGFIFRVWYCTCCCKISSPDSRSRTEGSDIVKKTFIL
jgi:hypothetical protein